VDIKVNYDSSPDDEAYIGVENGYTNASY